MLYSVRQWVLKSLVLDKRLFLVSMLFYTVAGSAEAYVMYDCNEYFPILLTQIDLTAGLDGAQKIIHMNVADDQQA